jgi:hypothetical protein
MSFSTTIPKSSLVNCLKAEIAASTEANLSEKIKDFLGTLEQKQDLDAIPPLALLLKSTKPFKSLHLTESPENQSLIQIIKNHISKAFEKYATETTAEFHHFRKKVEAAPNDADKVQAFRRLILLRSMTLAVSDQVPFVNAIYTKHHLDKWHKWYYQDACDFNYVKKLEGREIRYYMQQCMSQFAIYEGFNLIGLQLLIYLEQSRRQDFRCYAMDIKDVQKNLANLLSKPYTENAEQAQFIVDNNGHHTMIHFHLSNQVKDFVVFDAANLFISIQTIKKILDTQALAGKGLRIGTIGMPGIQSDFSSCPILSFDHAIQASRTAGLYDLVSNIKKTKGSIDWFDLPPQFVWNAQHQRSIDFYRETHQDIDWDEVINDTTSFNERTRMGQMKCFTNSRTGKMSTCLDTPDKLLILHREEVMHFINRLSNAELEHVFREKIITSVPTSVATHSLFGASRKEEIQATETPSENSTPGLTHSDTRK